MMTMASNCVKLGYMDYPNPSFWNQYPCVDRRSLISLIFSFFVVVMKCIVVEYSIGAGR